MRIYIDKGDRCPILIGEGASIESLAHGNGLIDITMRGFTPHVKSNIRRWIVQEKRDGGETRAREAAQLGENGPLVVFRVDGAVRVYAGFADALKRYPSDEYLWTPVYF